MSEEGYNGWTNYETWGAALILNNDPATQESAAEIVRTICEQVRNREEMYPFLRLEQRFEDLIRQLAHDGNFTGWEMASQLLGAALSRVNYREIAESFADDYDDGCLQEFANDRQHV